MAGCKQPDQAVRRSGGMAAPRSFAASHNSNGIRTAQLTPVASTTCQSGASQVTASNLLPHQ